MQAVEEQVRPEFTGSKASKELAERVFDAVSKTAHFYSHSAPIYVSLDAIVSFVAGDDGDPEQQKTGVEKALAENEHVFARVEREDGVYFATTRSGVAPIFEEPEDTAHTFEKRFQDPPPIPETVIARRTPPAMPTAAHEDIAHVAEAAPVSESPDEAVSEEAPVAHKPPPAPPVDLLTEITDASDEEIAEALKVQLAYDYAVANFGDLWMAEDRVPRLSRGDLRRIRDYINEQEAPVSDHQIVQDVLGIRPNAQEYDLHLFSVNFRLSRETRDFEFVGIAGNHLWTISGIVTPEIVGRKASEVGQDYRVLLDLEDAPADAEEGVVEHVLTHYEYRHGVLPFDAAFRSIVPGPVLEGQRSAILRFESPGTHEVFPIEARFPTSNRGGFLAGFASFFKEHLVPGAFVTIEVGESPGNYTIEFLTVSGQDRKLLKFDEKKGQYRFESQTFYCAPNEDMLLSENRFPKLSGTEPLDDRSRRQPEAVLVRTLELVGEQLDDADGKLMAVMDEVLAVANIERPMPAELIRTIASSDDYPQFTIDPEADDVIYYQPGVS
jgi:hypothetical protein